MSTNNLSRSWFLTGLLPFLMVSSTCLHAQAPASNVIAVESLRLVVGNLEQSVSFYRDVLGLEMREPISRFATVPNLADLANTQGAQWRTANLQIPGSPLGLELVEYKNVDRKPLVPPRFQDPGAVCIVLYVRDTDAVLARVRKANGRVVTKGGEPMDLPGKTRIRVVFVQDPDGTFFALSQHDPLSPTTAPITSAVIGASLELMVADAEQTRHIYTDVLGMPSRPPGPLREIGGINDGGGTTGATTRRISATVPGSDLGLTFVEYKSIDLKPVQTRVQDPGSSILRLKVNDLAAIVSASRAAGLEVISKNGQSVNLGTSRSLMMRDSNNLYLELVQGTPRP